MCDCDVRARHARWKNLDGSSAIRAQKYAHEIFREDELELWLSRSLACVLTPRKLGKNADQIQRLFLSPAEVFIVQYHGQIDQSVLEQMRAFATLNSVKEGKRIWYGVVDGDDTLKLLAAYPKQFSIE